MSSESDNSVKIFFIIVIFLCGWFGVLSPRCFDPFGKQITYGNLFSSGVLLSASLVHLLADATRDLEGSPLPTNANGESYPWGFLVCSFSFYILFVVERLLLAMFMDKIIQEKTNSQFNFNSNSNSNSISNSHSNSNYHRHNDTKHETADGSSSTHTHSSHIHIDDIEIVDLLLSKQYLSAILLLVGLGIHSFFAGLALGATQDFDDAVALGIAITCHKYLAAFALGVPLYKSQQSKIFSILMATIFGSFTPLGIGIGWGLEGAMAGWLTDLIVCIAAGTFLYVSIVEVLIPEFSHEKHIETQVLKKNSRQNTPRASVLKIGIAIDNPAIATNAETTHNNSNSNSNSNTNENNASTTGKGNSNTDATTPLIIETDGAPEANNNYKRLFADVETNKNLDIFNATTTLNAMKQQSDEQKENCLKMSLVVAGFTIMSILAIWI